MRLIYKNCLSEENQWLGQYDKITKCVLNLNRVD